ncbi:MAG: response regulator transcription factor [Bacillota bacterium]
MALRVLIADDHALLRQGVRQVLELEDDIEVVGEAAGGHQAIDLQRSLRPDVVILDISMPDLNGVEAAAAIKRHDPDVGIVILTIHSDDPYVFAAVQAGVAAYVLKDVRPELLVRAVREAAAGRSYLNPSVAHQLMREYARLATGGGRTPMAELTGRETEVLSLVAAGMTNSQIARTLFISEKTVKNHLSRVFEKLGVSDRTNAALLAVRHGLSSPRVRQGSYVP